MDPEVLEMYRKNLNLYEELKSLINDPLKFLEAAWKAENRKSIFENSEIILGDHPYNIELWKKCFEYAEKHCQAWVSLYC